MANRVSIFIVVSLILTSCFTVVERRDYQFAESFDRNPDREAGPQLPVPESVLHNIPTGTDTFILTNDFLRLAQIRDHLLYQGFGICEYNYQYDMLSARISLEEDNMTLVLFFSREGENLRTRVMWSRNTRRTVHSQSRGGIMSTSSGDRENPNNNQGRERRTDNEQNDGQQGLERRPDRDGSNDNSNRRDDDPPSGIITPEWPPPDYDESANESKRSKTRMPRIMSRPVGWELVTRDEDLYSPQGIAFANTLHVLTREIPHSSITYEYAGFEPPSKSTNPCEIDPRRYF